MKNFRKTIIALATVAAMLVPSVAMAATITAEVAPEVAGNVYAGIYNGGVLQKAVLGGVTEAQAGAGSTEDEELTQPIISAEILTADDANDIKKLVFAIKAPAGTTLPATGITLSYDNTVVTPANGATPASWGAYTDLYTEYAHETIKTQYETIGNRTGVYAVATTVEEVTIELAEEKTMFLEFYFTANGEITKDTFKIETEVAPGSFADLIGDNGKEKGIAIGDQYWYGYCLNGTMQEDNVKFTGFEVIEDVVQPTDKPVVTVTDEFVGIGEAGNVHKLVFSVKAPEDAAEITSTEMTIAIDYNDVTLANSGTGKAVTTIKANSTATQLRNGAKLAGKFAAGAFCPDCDAWTPFIHSTSSTGSFADNIYTTTIKTEIDLNNGCGCVETMNVASKTMFTELYYVVKDGAKVDENTFKVSNISIEGTAAAFNGFPWATGGNKTLTIENVDLTGITYDEVKVFVWDDKQIAQCAPATGTVK